MQRLTFAALYGEYYVLLFINNHSLAFMPLIVRYFRILFLFSPLLTGLLQGLKRTNDMVAKQDNTGAFRKYVVEFFGTFFLVMTICMTSVGAQGQFAPMAAGLMLIVIMYSGFHISGGHFNPAVSLAVYLRGKLNSGDVLPYIVGQFLGGTLAAMLAGFLLTSMGIPEASPKELDIAPALIAEFLGTLLFVYVFLNLTTIKKTAGNVFYGLALGCTLTATMYAFGGVSVGAFNPAIALSLTMANLISWGSIWIFLVANFVGGVLAAFLSQYVNGPEA